MKQMKQDIEDFVTFIGWGTFIEINRLDGLGSYFAWDTIKRADIELGERVCDFLLANAYLD